MKKKVLVYGGGGHARVVVDCLLSQAFDVVGIVDEKHDGNLFGVARHRKYEKNLAPDAAIIVAIGDNQTRKRIIEIVHHPFINAIHGSAQMSKYSTLGQGCMILHNTVVQAASTIGNHVILNTGSQVDHDCTIGDFVHIGPGAVLCGNVAVGKGTLIGAGARIIPGVKIGAWAVIGAGAIVIRDIPDYAVVVGTPARVIKINSRP